VRVKIANWGIGIGLAAFGYLLIFGTFQNIALHAFMALYTIYAAFILAWPIILMALFGIWAVNIISHVARLIDSGR